MNFVREADAVAGRADAAWRRPVDGLLLTEPARSLADLVTLPLAAPWLHVRAARRRSWRARAAGAARVGLQHGAAAPVPAPARLPGARLEPRPQSRADRRGPGRAARRCSVSWPADRRAGVGDRLEPGRHLRQGTGPPAPGPGPAGDHAGQPVRADRCQAEPCRPRLPAAEPAARHGAGADAGAGEPPIGVPSTAVYSRRDGIVVVAGLHRAGDRPASERRGAVRAPRFRRRSGDACG